MLNVSACRPGNLINLIIIAPIKNKGINGALQDYRNASKAWIKTRYPQQCTNNQKRTYSEQTNHKTLIGPTKTNQDFKAPMSMHSYYGCVKTILES